MSEKIVGTPIANILYTTESEDSVEKTRGELEVPDPKVERALGILRDGDCKKNHDERGPQNEQSIS